MVPIMRTMEAGKSSLCIRGYSKKLEDGTYVGISLRPYLAVCGRSHGEARHKMDQLLRAYLEDAIRDERLPVVLKQAAPLSCRVEYLVASCVGAVSSVIRSLQSFKLEPILRPVAARRHA